MDNEYQANIRPEKKRKEIKRGTREILEHIWEVQEEMAETQEMKE